MSNLKEAISYILKHYPHKDQLSNARVTKMLYLADWHQAINRKLQITDIRWYFDNYGPFVWDIKKEIECHPEVFISIDTHNFYGQTKTLFSMKNKDYEPCLSDDQKQSLQHIIDVTEKLTWNDFIRLVYSTYPITSSSRYSYLDIVEKAKEYAA